MLRTFSMQEQNFDKENPWTGFLQSVAWAVRATLHTTLDATPGELVFGRDMIFGIEFKANWARIRERKQKLINDANKRENATRIKHKYKVGDYVTINHEHRKLEAPREGPYVITKVYANGTAKVQRGAVLECMSIRRLALYNLPRNSGSECHIVG